jgi:hypothetical protein
MLIERARQRLHAPVTDLVLAHHEPNFARYRWSQWTSLCARNLLFQGQARQDRGTETAADDDLDRLHAAQVLRRVSPMISARLATGLHPIGAALLLFFGPSGDSICPAAWRRQWHADDCARHAALGAVRTGVIWAAHRHPNGAGPDPAGRCPAAVRDSAGPGWPARRTGAVRLPYGSIVPGIVVAECREPSGCSYDRGCRR